MWRRNIRKARSGLRGVPLLAVAGLLLVGNATLRAQREVLPAGPMQEKARTLCLACHDARIMVQQQLDRATWARVMDKMIRWGTPVEPDDREALIDYFAEHFGPPPEGKGKAELAAGPGAAAVRGACLGCHNEQVIVERGLPRREWQSVVDKMIRWGAEVPADARAEILNYLARHYGPPSKKER